MQKRPTTNRALLNLFGWHSNDATGVGSDAELLLVEDDLADMVKKVEAIQKNDNWLKHNAYWLSLVIAIIALAFGSGAGEKLLGLWMDHRIDARTNKPLERLNKIEEGVIKTNAKLDLIYDLWKDQLKRAAPLKPADFKRHLPEVADSIKGGFHS